MEKKVVEDYSSTDYESEMDWKQVKPRKGGVITMPFIIANEAFAYVASYGLLPNMILYLTRDYRMSVPKGMNVLFLWGAASNFTPTIGAVLADSYIGRFFTITWGSIFSLLGIVGLWLTSMMPNLRPPPCSQKAVNCTSASQSQISILFSSFAIISIGTGGIRSSSLAFGADQLDNRDDPQNETILESYFSWYYVSVSVSLLIAVTVIVYLQDHQGWKIGFGVPAVLMLIATVLFVCASPLYVKQKPTKSLLIGLAQVLVVAFKNRKLALPPEDSGWYHSEIGSLETVPTDRLRFLNKACIVRNPDVLTSGVAKNPWEICTVQQVEELKLFIRVLPLWSTGIMMQINSGQGSFHLLQANSMDRHVTSHFQIPAGSFSVFVIITLTIWIFLYDRVLIPLASKLRGKPVRIGTKERMGIGLFISSLAMVVAAIVEQKRREIAIKEGFQNNPKAVLHMTAMWLVPQNCLFGLAEAFNAIGQTEFYYSEFPKNMSSIATSLFGLGMGVGSLLASLVLNIVNEFSSRGGKQSWVASNINEAHYDYYLWVLAILSFINVLYFMICSWAYGPCAENHKKNVSESDKSPHVSYMLGTPPPGTPLRIF